MGQALTPPFLVAGLVLCVAGAAKLRSPAAATRALAALGLPARAALVRAFSVCELVLGLWCVADPGPLTAGLMACLYALFAALTFVLARRRASCGCFGDGEVPASSGQSILSGALSLVALAGMLSVPHSLHWVLQRPPIDAAILIIGIAGSVYGIVLAYTEAPLAWRAWSAR
jgi:uncharacterized membrane protein YphA (DoxX/SURF4 family)